MRPDGMKWVAPICPQCNSLTHTLITVIGHDQDGNEWWRWFCMNCDKKPEGGYRMHQTCYPFDEIIEDITTARTQADRAISDFSIDIKKWERELEDKDDG